MLAPPRLLRLLAGVTLHAYLTGWRPERYLAWLSRVRRALKASGGASQVTCFGLNPHAVWEVTARCNLSCLHCHARLWRGRELGVEEGRRLLREVALAGVRAMVFSGGEPLLRGDLVELIAEARDLGLDCFVATNGTLITRRVARAFKRLDVGVVVGLDAMRPEVHDALRGVAGSHRMVMEGIRNSVAEDLYLHVNVVATRLNYSEVWRVLEFSEEIGAYSAFIYLFMPVGAGAEHRDLALGPSELARLMDDIARAQSSLRLLVVPVGLPQLWAYLAWRRGVRSTAASKLMGLFIGGCLADKGMAYIKPDGTLWPCPFLPVELGNVVRDGLRGVWRSRLVELEGLRLKLCEACKYRYLCGGCLALNALSRGKQVA